MKLFEVQFERDGGTRKIDGGTETEIKKTSVWIAAKDIKAVWQQIQWLMVADTTVTLIAEKLPHVEIAKPISTKRGKK